MANLSPLPRRHNPAILPATYVQRCNRLALLKARDLYKESFRHAASSDRIARLCQVDRRTVERWLTGEHRIDTDALSRWPQLYRLFLQELTRLVDVEPKEAA